METLLLKFCLILGMCFTSVGDIEFREYAVNLPVHAETYEVGELISDEQVAPEKVYPYPEYISVRITGVKECDEVNGRYTHIEIVPFKDYIKGVLANEWGANWTSEEEYESIKAGAVAVKAYALNAVLNGGKWGGFQYGNVYDCDWDMVYDPDITRPQHNQAVEDTWDYYLVDESGEVPRKIHFLAWYTACVNWLGDTGHCMGQWKSRDDAMNGMTFDEILVKYYYNMQVVNVLEVE